MPTLTPTPTPDPTAGWRVYRNKTFNFEIKHPPEFLEVENITPTDLTQGVVSFYAKGGDRCRKDDISLFINFNNEGGTIPQQELISSESIKMGPVQTELTLRKLPSDDKCIILGKSKRGDFVNAYIYFESEGNKWSIVSRLRTDHLESDLSLFKQILSTFKFLD